MNSFPESKITFRNLSQFINHLKQVSLSYQLAQTISNYDVSSLKFIKSSDLIGDNDTILQKLNTCHRLNVASDEATRWLVMNGNGGLMFS